MILDSNGWGILGGWAARLPFVLTLCSVQSLRVIVPTSLA